MKEIPSIKAVYWRIAFWTALSFGNLLGAIMPGGDFPGWVNLLLAIGCGWIALMIAKTSIPVVLEARENWRRDKFIKWLNSSYWPELEPQRDWDKIDEAMGELSRGLELTGDGKSCSHK
jgi:hypothetical protein